VPFMQGNRIPTRQDPGKVPASRACGNFDSCVHRKWTACPIGALLTVRSGCPACPTGLHVGAGQPGLRKRPDVPGGARCSRPGRTRSHRSRSGTYSDRFTAPQWLHFNDGYQRSRRWNAIPCRTPLYGMHTHSSMSASKGGAVVSKSRTATRSGWLSSACCVKNRGWPQSGLQVHCRCRRDVPPSGHHGPYSSTVNTVVSSVPDVTAGTGGTKSGVFR
jgi:hypothetical protein